MWGKYMWSTAQLNGWWLTFQLNPCKEPLFIKFRDFILNIDSQFPEIVNHRSVLGNHMNKTMPHHKGWQANGDVQQI